MVNVVVIIDKNGKEAYWSCCVLIIKNNCELNKLTRGREIMNENINTLKEKIEIQREKLKTTVENKRLDDIEVHKKSEKLDKLLNQYY